MKKKTILILTFAIFFSCSKEKAKEIASTPTTPVACNPVSFSADLQPIFQSYGCTSSSCHSSSNAADGITLDSHAGVTAVNSNRLLGAINQTGTYTSMPFSGKLTDEEITKLTCWIEKGSNNN